MIFFIFLLGLAVGSFLNVLIDRLPREESPFKGRSYCEHCKKPLVWYDLIPLLSFVVLKGKCRYCHSPISFYYPTVELITASLFVLTFFLTFTSEESRSLPRQVPDGTWPRHLRGGTESLLGGDFLELGYYLFIVSGLIVIFFADLKYGIIPDKVVFPSVGISLFYLFINHPSADGFINHLLVAISAFLFFLLLYIVTKGRGMGFGDVKLVFLLGLFLGWPQVIVAFYIAFLTGAIFGCILILWGKKRFHGSTLPFGPFLVGGTLAALFFGQEMIRIVFPFLVQT